MTDGKVIGIFLARKRGEPTFPVDKAYLIPGKGIEGDRYFDYANNPENRGKTGRQITLVESEVLNALKDIDGIKLEPGRTRRNIVTSGISLNDLVDCVFYIGNVQLQGIRLCEPCQYLADRTDQRILHSLVHKGGLRADILTEGIIQVNDRIYFSDQEQL